MEDPKEKFELVEFDQFSPSMSDIPLKEYVHKHIYYSLISILKQRPEYQKARENNQAINKSINEKTSEYFMYFKKVTESFAGKEIKTEKVTKEAPTFGKEQSIIDYCNVVMEYMDDQAPLVDKIFIDPIINSFSIITPKTVDEVIQFAFANFTVSSHYVGGFNNCIDALYTAIKDEHEGKITPCKYYSYKQRNIKGFANFTPETVESDSSYYVIQLMALSLMDEATEIIKNELYHTLEYPEQQLELCARVIDCCESLKQAKTAVVAATLRCIAAYLHVYSYRPINEPPNNDMINHIRKAIIYCASFSDNEHIVESLALMVSLVPRDIYSQELCKAVFPVTKGAEMKFIKDIKFNPQTIFSAIYGNDCISSKLLLSITESISLMNTIFKADEALVPFVYLVFDRFMSDPQLISIKIIVEQISCITAAPRMALAFILATKKHLEVLKGIFETERVFAAYYMMVLGHFVDVCIESIPSTENERSIEIYTESYLNKCKIIPIKEAKFSPFIMSLISSKTTPEVDFLFEYMNVAVPFLLKKMPSEELLKYERLCLAAILIGTKAAPEFEQFSKTIFEQKAKATPKNSSAVPLKVKKIWKSLYVIRRLLMNSFQKDASHSKSSDLKDNFANYTKEISKKVQFILTCQNLILKSEYFDDVVQQITMFLVSSYRIEDIDYIIARRNEKLEMRKKTIDFLIDVTSYLSSDEEFYLYANITKDFHRINSASKEYVDNLKDSITKFEKYITERSGVVTSNECVVAYAMHYFVPYNQMLKIIKVCKNEILVNAAWFAILYFTVVFNDKQYVNGLLELSTDFSVDRLQLCALSVLQNLDMYPVPVQGLIEKFAKNETESLYISLSLSASEKEGIDESNLIKYVTNMLLAIGTFVTKGNGTLAVIEEMICFIRVQIQKKMVKTRDSALKAIHQALMKLDRSMPVETVGALVVLGIGGIPTESQYLMKGGVMHKNYSGVENGIPCTRILPNPEDFELTDEEASLIETNFAVFANLIKPPFTISDLSALTISIFFSALPVIIGNKANIAKFKPDFIKGVVEVANRNAGKIGPIGPLISAFGNIPLMMAFKKYKIFDSQAASKFITVLNMPESKQTVRMLKSVINKDSTRRICVALHELSKRAFVGYITPETTAENFVITGFNLDLVTNINVEINITGGKMYVNDYGFIDISSNIIPVIVSDGKFDENYKSNKGFELKNPINVDELTISPKLFLGATVNKSGLTGAVTGVSGNTFSMHAGNGRIVTLKAKGFSLVKESMSTIIDKLSYSNRNTDIEALMINLCRLCALSFLKEKMITEEASVISILYKCVITFFKFQLGPSAFSYDDYDELTPYNMKSYKSFFLKFIQDKSIFEKLCKFAVEQYNNAEEFEEIIPCSSQTFITPPEFALMLPKPRHWFTKDIYAPGKIFLTNDPYSHPSMCFNLIRIRAIDNNLKPYALTTLINLMKISGHTLLGVYCRTVFPCMTNNILYSTIILSIIGDNKKLFINTLRVLLPPPTHFDKFIDSPMSRDIGYLSYWSQAKLGLYNMSLSESERKADEEGKWEQPAPINHRIFGSSMFEDYLDDFIIIASVADHSIGIPQFPPYIYSQYYVSTQSYSKTIIASATLKNLSFNSKITFDSIEGGLEPGQLVEALIPGGTKKVLKIGQTITVNTSTCRINLVGTKRKKVVISVSSQTKPGEAIPPDFRMMCENAEKLWKSMFDYSIYTARDILPCIPGVEQSIVEIRSKILMQAVQANSRYKFESLVSSSTYSIEYLESIIKEKIKKFFENYPPEDNHILFDRFSAAWFFETGRGKSLLRQLANKIRGGVPYQQLAHFTTNWHVNFRGEGSIDAGGPRREAFDDICNEILYQNYSFILSPSSRVNRESKKIPASNIRKDDLRVCGAVVAATYVQNCKKPFEFEDIVWKSVIGEEITEADVFEVDAELKEVVDAVRQGIPEVYKFKNLQGKELETFIVTFQTTEAKRENYALNMIRRRTDELKAVLSAFAAGFHFIIPLSVINGCTYDIIKRIMIAEENISVQDMLSCMNIKSTPRGKEMFLKALNQLSPKQRHDLIKFTTGSTALPTGGDRIHVAINDDGNPELMTMRNAPLPHAGTCFKTLSMPLYASYQIMTAKLITAMEFSSFITDIEMDNSAFVNPE